MAQISKLENGSRTADHPGPHEVLVRRELRRRSRSRGPLDRSCNGGLARVEATTAEHAGNASSLARAVRPRSDESELARRTSEMRLRNLAALEIAAMLGFSLGLLEALVRLSYGPTLRIAEVGLAIAVVVGLAATFRSRERIAERVCVSLLRAGLSGVVFVFVFVFEGMRLFLKIGHIGLALGWWVWAGVLALLLIRLAPSSQSARRAPTNGIAPLRRGRWSEPSSWASRQAESGPRASVSGRPVSRPLVRTIGGKRLPGANKEVGRDRA